MHDDNHDADPDRDGRQGRKRDREELSGAREGEPRSWRSSASGGRGGGSYGQQDYSSAARRSQWREGDRYVDTGWAAAPADAREVYGDEDERYGGGCGGHSGYGSSGQGQFGEGGFARGGYGRTGYGRNYGQDVFAGGEYDRRNYGQDRAGPDEGLHGREPPGRARSAEGAERERLHRREQSRRRR